ncbi:MAG: peptidoglycan DD-metalloendopeptidase family protein [Hespellia sp.]|nr:peptidoglycan DD-metalloendopeptidase family protein [Hespellia sp.]
MTKRKRRVLSIVLVMVLSISMGLSANATSISDAEEKAAELEEQKKKAEADKASLTDQINAIAVKASETQEKLNTKAAEIDEAQNKLVEAKLVETKQYDDMKLRIKYMYESGESQFLEILMKSENMADFISNAEYVQEVSSYDRGMLTEYQNTVKKVEAQEVALQSEYDEITVMQEELAAKHDEVQALLDDSNTKLADIESEIGDNAETLEKLKQEAANVAANASSGSGTFTPGGGNVVSGNGYFTNPCPSAYISSEFGPRSLDGRTYHYGRDYAAGEGTPTYAAAAGTVIMAGWAGTAGNWVVIDHGNGLVTKYMHHSAVCVSAGQSVAKGQQIGRVGNTGHSFGAHLHFQVEKNGSPVDPRGYL